VVGLGLLLVVLVVAVELQNVGGDDGLGLIEPDASSSYADVTLLVFLDAVCPVFPGETTLNAASTLAAQGTLDLWLVILAGAIEAIAGDSALYRASRLFSRRTSRLSAPGKTTRSQPRLRFSETARRCFLPPDDSFLAWRFVVSATLRNAEIPLPTVPPLVRDRGAVWGVYTCIPRLLRWNRAGELPARLRGHLRCDHDPADRPELLESEARRIVKKPLPGAV
jgi:membrane-associated protein